MNAVQSLVKSVLRFIVLFTEYLNKRRIWRCLSACFILETTERISTTFDTGGLKLYSAHLTGPFGRWSQEVVCLFCYVEWTLKFSDLHED